MVRYTYARQCAPPAPFVHVALRRPDGAAEAKDLPAQLDTAADRTVIPSSLVEALSLAPMGDVLVAGFGGNITTLPTFLLTLEIRQLPALTVKVVASPHEPYVLLGRDVLNQFRIVLDGPQLALEIG